MAKRTPLKVAIFQACERQFVVAKRAGLQESRLSVLVNGHQAPTAKEAKALARVLKTTIHALFPGVFDDEAVAS